MSPGTIAKMNWLKKRTWCIAMFVVGLGLTNQVAQAGDFVPGPSGGLNWVSLLTISAAVAMLLLVASRGRRALAATILSAAGLLFLTGVGYVLVFNLTRYREPPMYDEHWMMAEQFPYYGPPQPPYAPSPEFVRPVFMHPPARPFRDSLVAPQAHGSSSLPHPVAEVSATIPEELAQAAPDSALKPTWVGTPAALQADGVYRVAVSAGPYESADPEAQKALNRELARAVREYIEAERGTGAADRVAYAQSDIRRLVKETWNEPYQSETPTLGPMVRLHALLVFDDAARRDIERRHEKSLVSGRLKATGSSVGALLISLAALFGYLKLDTMTRGYYSGRLKTAAGAVIVAAVALAALLTA